MTGADGKEEANGDMEAAWGESSLQCCCKKEQGHAVLVGHLGSQAGLFCIRWVLLQHVWVLRSMIQQSGLISGAGLRGGQCWSNVPEVGGAGVRAPAGLT